MSHRRFVIACSFLLLLANHSLLAATYYVGSCKIASFGSISAAIATVPDNSVIQVCPGTYNEQLIINHPLTIKGMFSNNSSQVVIARPSAGLSTYPSIFLNGGAGTVDAQVLVTAENVNISGITVDGASNGGNCPTTWFAAIFYATGSSGTINQIEAINENCNGIGIGILMENGSGTPESLLVTNSSVHDFTATGVWSCSTQSPSTLTATIKGNSVSASAGSGISPYCNAAGTVSGNVIDGVSWGVYLNSPSALVTGNTISNSNIGILVNADGGTGTTANSNNLIKDSTPISLANDGATIKGNRITQSPVGMDFGCHTATVMGNQLNGTPKGFINVPASFVGTNSFYNVPAVRTGC